MDRQLEPGTRGGHDTGQHAGACGTERFPRRVIDDVVELPIALVPVVDEEPSLTGRGEVRQLLVVRDEAVTLLLNRRNAAVEEISIREVRLFGHYWPLKPRTGRPEVPRGMGCWGWSRAEATSLYGWYTGLAYLLPVLGGYLADRYLGTRRAVGLGGFVIAACHLSMFLNTASGTRTSYEIPPGTSIKIFPGLFDLILPCIFDIIFSPCLYMSRRTQVRPRHPWGWAFH